jgi:hypothetical protein
MMDSPYGQDDQPQYTGIKIIIQLNGTFRRLEYNIPQTSNRAQCSNVLPSKESGDMRLETISGYDFVDLNIVIETCFEWDFAKKKKGLCGKA